MPAPSRAPARAHGPSRSGSADLPLHGGRVPAWLHQRMARLGRVIAEAIVLHYGRRELVRRLAHPFWFQSFGAVMGMDWHSSGITTSVVGALKRGLEPVRWELGVHVCGGRGKQSRRTPEELQATGARTGLDGGALARASRLVAKVDSAAVQDGFELYLHAFVATDDGDWAVVQQGMNTGVRRARRYHWLAEGLESFVEEPHAAIEGVPGGAVVNLTDRRAAASRAAQLDLVRRGPDIVVREARRIAEGRSPHLQLPSRHDVRADDVVLRRLHGAIAAAAERGPADFEELLLTPGLGARTVLALALVAEVVHGAPCRFSDPARFSLAHGGKDGHPYPVPLEVYDETIGVLRSAVDRARLGQDDRLAAIRRLDEEARRLERAASDHATAESFETFVARERAASASLGGRSVLGPARDEAPGAGATRSGPPGAGPGAFAAPARGGDAAERRGEGPPRGGAALGSRGETLGRRGETLGRRGETLGSRGETLGRGVAMASHERAGGGSARPDGPPLPRTGPREAARRGPAAAPAAPERSGQLELPLGMSRRRGGA